MKGVSFNLPDISFPFKLDNRKTTLKTRFVKIDLHHLEFLRTKSSVLFKFSWTSSEI